MKIGISTLCVTPTKMGGRTYLINLIESLANLDKKNIYYLFLSKLNKSIFESLVGINFRYIIFPIKSENPVLRIFYEQFVIPIYTKCLGIDILVCPGSISTLFPNSKCISIVQFPYKYMLGNISKIRRLYFTLLLPLSIKISDRVIAVSEDIKKALINDFKTREPKIETIYEGVDKDRFSKFLVLSKRNHLDDLNKPYILFVSTLFDHKNPDKLIKAFSKIKLENKLQHDLVLVGKDPGRKIAKLSILAEKSRVKENVKFVGPVLFEKIGNYYKEADLFVYPSSAESFGLPVLEAMACGTPVVASNKASVPEVVGNAGILVDPDNIDELATAMLRVLLDINLRRKLIELGYDRVEQFSWENTAKEFLQVFEELAGNL